MFKKDFWKYFYSTYKNAKWLLLGYLIVSIYLSVSSIFANTMNISNLTYFNAMITVAVFFELIAFGIANGVGVYINQNIHDKEKASNYVKIGFYLNFLTSFSFVVILALLKNPILHGLLGLPKQINYIFFYCMLIYTFLNCILKYLAHALKTLKNFKWQMLTSLIQCILLVSGFLILWLANNIALTFIPLIYIITTLVSIIFGIVALAKNKELPVNLLKFTKFKLTKKEISIILYMSGIEIIWQVGYTMLSLFLLKISEPIFNQYTYFENVLDIFNGLFFSFVAVTSIEICQNLGEQKYDEAYKHGKHSLYATLIIWFVYFLLSCAFIIPIKMGMNIELQSTAIISMILYVVMYLGRFLIWNLSSYILCWGGKVKIQFWLEIASACYFILLFCIAKYLPNNIYLIYLLISADVIIRLPIELIIFKKKKWLKNINLD